MATELRLAGNTRCEAHGWGPAPFLGESNLLPATVAETGDGEVVLTTGDGRSIRACGGDDVEPGERVKYMVRPENVDFVDSAEPGNTVEGVLKETIMSGQITKYFLELPDGSEMVATRLTGGARGNPATGEITRFGWTAERTVVLKDH